MRKLMLLEMFQSGFLTMSHHRKSEILHGWVVRPPLYTNELTFKLFQHRLYSPDLVPSHYVPNLIKLIRWREICPALDVYYNRGIAKHWKKYRAKKIMLRNWGSFPNSVCFVKEILKLDNNIALKTWQNLKSIWIIKFLNWAKLCDKFVSCAFI